MNTEQKKQNSPLIEIAINVLIPSFILMKLSGDDKLGTVGALMLALALPLVYGGYELVTNKKFNFIALLGFVSVLLTGGIGLLELDTKWLALKEALIPGLIGIAVLGSTYTKFPIVKKMVMNDAIFNLPLIEQSLVENNQQSRFEQSLLTSNYMFAGTFLFSSIMNYVLATWIVTSPAGTEAFNNELGRLTLISYPMIAIPSIVMMLGIFYYLWRQIQKLTKLETEQIIRQ
uniref:VC0807 family protein n=1 Tax=Thaumasiovibrio occultus TaxID=1891184 RepID=UPI000B36161D|nr:VC0807 family protein [Thaumasiovibrio occultus]